jgi:hypothetical protein
MAARAPRDKDRPVRRAARGIVVNAAFGSPRSARRAVMPPPPWNDSYASREPLPWDTGTRDPMLVDAFRVDPKINHRSVTYSAILLS